MLKNKDLIKRIDFSKEIIDSEFNKFEADVIGGNLFILAGPQNKASIRLQWKEGAQHLLPKFFIEDNVLKLESKQWKVFGNQKNAYIIEITLPENTNINVKMFAGVIYLGNLTGDIDLQLKAGEILGNVSSKNVTAKLWAGDINLEFASIDKDSKIDLKCSLGDIKLKLPRNIVPDANFIKIKKFFDF